MILRLRRSLTRRGVLRLLPFAEYIAAFGRNSYNNGDGAQNMPAKRKHEGAPRARFAEEEHAFAHDEIIRGIKAKRVKDLIDRGVLGAKEVFRVIPERTFSRRLANREALKIAEADTIGRFLRIVETANKTFGSRFRAQMAQLAQPGVERSDSHGDGRK